jgi:hypothetical protein
MKLDAKRREYDIIVIGEEGHLAYNRVGLTSFFQHRKVENLYLNPKEWVRDNIQLASNITLTASTVLCLSRRLPELPPQYESNRNPPPAQTRLLLFWRDSSIRHPRPSNRLRCPSPTAHTWPRCGRRLRLPYHRRSAKTH